LIKQHERYRSEALGCRHGVGTVLLFILLSGLTAIAQVSGPGQPLTDSTISHLRAQIASDSIEAKRTALFEIRNYSSADASRLALPALTDKDEIVRSTAASSVIFLPKAEAARALLPLLGDRAEFVRREAAHALGEVGDASATSSLATLMQRDKVLEVRTAAAVSLGRIGDSSAVNALVGVLQKKPTEDDEFLRRSAARSIGQIAQMQTSGATAVLTPQNFLPDKFKDLNTGAAQTNLSAATSVLIRVLTNSSESDDTRREAAFALGAIGDPVAKPTLQRFVTSPDPYLAEICREALLKIDSRNKS
jgi:HEAT repeat protein